jgi:hypothetical protein
MVVFTQSHTIHLGESTFVSQQFCRYTPFQCQQQLRVQGFLEGGQNSAHRLGVQKQSKCMFNVQCSGHRTLLRN